MQYNQIGKTGVLVSELCLGTMTFGGKGFWENIGRQTQEEANLLIQAAVDQGINFFDTANGYSDGLSEIMLGKAVKDLNIDRQLLFIASKVRLRMGAGANQVGLSRSHIAYAVEDSLKRLNMSHIDLLYIHGVDPITSFEETMRGLEDVVRAGKVRYLGVSNHPAWMVMKANGFASHMGWTRFTATTNYYSIASRDIEREIIPMTMSEDIALVPWSPLAGGFLSGKYSRDKLIAGDSRRDKSEFPFINKEKAFQIIDLMADISKNHNNVSVAQVAIAWMLKKPAVTSIIIGAKKIEQLSENIAATRLHLSDEEMQQLDAISALPTEYPGWMVERQAIGRWPA